METHEQLPPRQSASDVYRIVKTRPATDQLIGIEEVALILDASVRTIRRWIASGKVPKPVQIGHKLKWRTSIVQEWIEDGCPKQRRPR